MIRIEYAVDISAPPSRVWRALCDPSEVVRWESGVVAVLDAPADYPRPGQRVHWRTTGSPARVLLDEPHVVEEERVLRSLLKLGRVHMDESYTLTPIPAGVRLAVLVEATYRLPVVERLIERFSLQRSLRRDFEAALDSIRVYVEGRD